MHTDPHGEPRSRYADDPHAGTLSQASLRASERRPPGGAGPVGLGARVGRDHAPLPAPAALLLLALRRRRARRGRGAADVPAGLPGAARRRAARDRAARRGCTASHTTASIDLLRKGSPEYEQLDLEFDGVAQPPTLFEQREEIRGWSPACAGCRGPASGAGAARARGPQLRGDLRAARPLRVGRPAADLPGAHGAAQRRGGAPAVRSAERPAGTAPAVDGHHVRRPPFRAGRRAGAGDASVPRRSPSSPCSAAVAEDVRRRVTTARRRPVPRGTDGGIDGLCRGPHALAARRCARPGRRAASTRSRLGAAQPQAPAAVLQQVTRLSVPAPAGSAAVAAPPVAAPVATRAPSVSRAHRRRWRSDERAQQQALSSPPADPRRRPHPVAGRAGSARMDRSATAPVDRAARAAQPQGAAAASGSRKPGTPVAKRPPPKRRRPSR